MNIRNAKFTLATLLVSSLAASGWAQSTATGNEPLRANIENPAAAPDTATARPAAHDMHYVIGNDDVLAINVWKEPDLTQSLTVRSDGKISMPLIGEITAAGKTPAQLEQEITDKLRTYITQPEVTVMVSQMNSVKFNILGRVMKPGSYSLSATTTVLDAIAQAGGFQDFAKQKKIYILRQSASGGEARIPFNYKSIIHGEHPEQNIRLEPRDTIVVP
jgi:polysaccharide export outer membrane protein